MEKCIYYPDNRTDVLLDHRKPLRERNLADERGEEERTSGAKSTLSVAQGLTTRSVKLP
jgi:hypothetical protein